MKELYSYMKQCGKTTFLEVVAYTEEECMEGAKMGVACGVDYLLEPCTLIPSTTTAKRTA